jgi:hypothetical protein
VNFEVVSRKELSRLNRYTVLARILDFISLDYNISGNFILIRAFQPFFQDSSLFLIRDVVSVEKQGFTVNDVKSVGFSLFNDGFLNDQCRVDPRSYNPPRSRPCPYY